MRALKNDTAKLGIAVSVVAPGITLTDILREPGESLQDAGKRMGSAPINKAEQIADYVAYLIAQGMHANGKGLLVLDGKAVDLEKGLALSRKIWMGEEMLRLFRAGRDAPLFVNKL